MRGKIFYGLLLIICLSLAGPAWGDGNPQQGVGTSVPGLANGRDDKAVPSMAPSSADGTGAVSEKGIEKKDVFAAYDEIAPKSEAAPKAEALPKSEIPSEAAPAPKVESPAEGATAPEVATPPESQAAADEAKQEEATEEATIADPIEPWNRAMFQFNDKLYFWFLKPVARGYNAVFPEPVRVSVRDFFRNAAMPVRFVSSLFQGKLKGAGTEIARFSINTTLGLAGFFDVAKSWFNLDPSEEDLGQTLGSYGMGGMMYIVWPFLGPSTVRDTLGFAGDSFLDPFNYIDPFYIPLGVHAYERINKTSLDLKTYEDLVESSLEPYIAVRDAFIQNRNEMIRK